MSRSVFDPEAGLPPQVSIPVSLELVKDCLMLGFAQSGDYDGVVRLIVQLDLSCHDWGVTEKLIAHFKALELEYEKEEPGVTPVPPKKIEP